PVWPARSLTCKVTSVPGSLTETLPTHCPEVNFSVLNASTAKAPPAPLAVNCTVPAKFGTNAPVEDLAVMIIRNGTYACRGDVIVEKVKWCNVCPNAGISGTAHKIASL